MQWCGRHLGRSPIIRLRNFIYLLRFMRSQDVVDAAADAFLSLWQRLQPFDDVFTQSDCYLSFRGLGLGSPSDIFPVQDHGYVGRVYFSVRHPSEFFQFFPLLFVDEVVSPASLFFIQISFVGYCFGYSLGLFIQEFAEHPLRRCLSFFRSSSPASSLLPFPVGYSLGLQHPLRRCLSFFRVHSPPFPVGSAT